jgi:hypothetical protein
MLFGSPRAVYQGPTPKRSAGVVTVISFGVNLNGRAATPVEQMIVVKLILAGRAVPRSESP